MFKFTRLSNMHTCHSLYRKHTHCKAMLCAVWSVYGKLLYRYHRWFWILFKTFWCQGLKFGIIPSIVAQISPDLCLFLMLIAIYCFGLVCLHLQVKYLKHTCIHVCHSVQLWQYPFFLTTIACFWCSSFYLNKKKKISFCWLIELNRTVMSVTLTTAHICDVHLPPLQSKKECKVRVLGKSK